MPSDRSTGRPSGSGTGPGGPHARPVAAGEGGPPPHSRSARPAGGRPSNARDTAHDAAGPSPRCTMNSTGTDAKDIDDAARPARTRAPALLRLGHTHSLSTSAVARMSMANRRRRCGTIAMPAPVHLGPPSPPSGSRSSVPPLPVPGGAWPAGGRAAREAPGAPARHGGAWRPGRGGGGAGSSRAERGRKPVSGLGPMSST